MLNKKDICYIAEKLSQPAELVNKITEETRDANLILQEVAVKAIKKEDYKKVSSLSYVKLVTFRYSYDTDFDIDEKAYVAQSIYAFYPSIYKALDFNLIVSKGVSEIKSQYFLVLAGLFYDIVPSKFFPPLYQNCIIEGFKAVEHVKSLTAHVSSWLSILKEIHLKHWLDP